MSAAARQIRTWTLPHDLTAARSARDHVREYAAHHALDPSIADDLGLVASELAVNAVRHGSGGATLHLQPVDGGVRVSVQGSSVSTDPVVGDVDDLATSGRGLAMVAALAQDWGWARDGDQVTVWALL